MNDREQQKRAQDAKLIIDSPIYKEAWDAVRARLTEIMATARTDEATLHAKVMLGLLTDVRAHLDRVMREGQIATAAIELEQKEAERRKSSFGNLLHKVIHG